MITNGADLYQVLRKAPQFAHEAHSTVLLGNESNTGPLLASLQVNCNVQDISLDHTRRLKERRCVTNQWVGDPSSFSKVRATHDDYKFCYRHKHDYCLISLLLDYYHCHYLVVFAVAYVLQIGSQILLFLELNLQKYSRVTNNRTC